MPDRRYLIGFFLLGMASAAGAGSEDKGVDAWIAQMVQAVRTLPYEGTFVYLHDAQLESMKITHAVNKDRKQERLISLNGAAREVIRNSDAVICILPDSKAVSVAKRHTEHIFPSILPVSVDELSDYYEFRLLGDARVADRSVKVIGVIPNDKFRYGYRLFLDAEHALPLQTDTLNESGQLVARIMFTSLRVDAAIRDISPSVPDADSGYMWVHPAPAKELPIAEHASWKFTKLPAGFKLKIREQRPSSSGAAEVEHFVLSDGLATLSVYVEQAGKEGELRAASKIGAVNAFGTQISGHQVTVVGEVPAKTVRHVAYSMMYLAGQ
ncbi:Sigma factor RpoE negative regulatory protein RseB precursor [hydrothermal vent metagenome]|uniref:Sigma factor RpoE negative regulatory protein RseB n=1 Tax=hydrothermal vent metagenome TaxID=652676 RepID=A0A3B1B1D5_9ZZZZ